MYFFRWKFAGSEGTIDVPEGEEIILGRGNPSSVSDVRTSRRQVSVECRDGTVRVRALGVNPSIVLPETFLLRDDKDSIEIHVGDTLCLLCDKMYPFTLCKKDVKQKSAEKTEKVPSVAERWQWRADDGWKDYPPEVAKSLEDGRRNGKDRVDIDDERFVDLRVMCQRRKDKPNRTREVRHFSGELAQPSSPVKQQSQSTAKVIRVPKTPTATSAPGSKIGSSSSNTEVLAKCVIHFIDSDDFKNEASLRERAEKLGARMTPSVKNVTHFIVSQRAATTNDHAKEIVRSLTEAEAAPVVTPEWLKQCVNECRIVDTAPFTVSSEQSVKPPPAKVSRKTPSSTIDSFFGGGKKNDGGESEEKVVWYWRRDDGEWEPYSDALSRKIEAVFKSPNSDEYRVVIDKKRYVDLVQMKQRHHVNDDLEREIKREVL